MNNYSFAKESKTQSGLRFLVVFSALILAAILFGSTSAHAFSMESGDFLISYRGSAGAYKEVLVEDYNGTSTQVTLPATVTIEGTTVPVTGIKGDAFKNNGKITSVSIPEGYTELPVEAFLNCIRLESVNIPASVTMISANAFSGCTALKNVTFDGGSDTALSLKNAAFINCTSLERIQLPARLTDLDNGNVFYGCTKLSSVTVEPGSQTLFAENNLVFQRNEDGSSATLCVYPFGLNQQKVQIPARAGGLDVTALAPFVFRNNAVITEVELPASVTQVERYAFQNCAELKSVRIMATSALELNSECFGSLPQGSVIYVPNETVAASFEPADQWTSYYNPETTSIQVAAAAPAAVEAALSLKPAGLTENGAVRCELYLDSASYVSTLLLKLNFDPAQLTMDSVVLSGEVFDNVTTENVSDGTVKLMFNQFGNEVGYTGDAPVKIAVITLTREADTTGRLTLTAADPRVSGVTDVAGASVKGSATLNQSSAAVFVANYDVNGDGTVDQVDITEAQRYYQETSVSENWETAMKSDVNGDSKVDLEDLIAIFRNLTNF